MRRLWLITMACLMASSLAAVQKSSGPAPISERPKVEVRGKIERIRISRGQGMPTLDVKTDDRIVNVTLGSMRYLLEQDFNPKAGEEVVISGYKMDEDLVAISVKIPATGKVLRLRDENGRPLWMGGRRGGRSVQ